MIVTGKNDDEDQAKLRVYKKNCKIFLPFLDETQQHYPFDLLIFYDGKCCIPVFLRWFS